MRHNSKQSFERDLQNLFKFGEIKIRKDMLGNPILKGKKKHKVTFRDQVESTSLPTLLHHSFKSNDLTPKKSLDLPIMKRILSFKPNKPREPQERVKFSLVNP